jgi:hypothetical protein
MDEPSVDRVPEPSASGAPRAVDADTDELSDAALDAVVGGLSVEAALLRASAFDAGRLS